MRSQQENPSTGTKDGITEASGIDSENVFHVPVPRAPVGLTTHVSTRTGLIVGGAYLVMGLALMFGAGVLSRLTYGRKKSN